MQRESDPCPQLQPRQRPVWPSPWLPTISFDVPLETAGKRGHRIAQAEHLSESARLNIAVTAWHVRAGVRSSLLDLSATRQREALLQNEISIQRQIIALLDQQIQTGAMAGPEAVPFRIALQKSQLDLADAQRESAESRAHLAESIGIPVPRWTAWSCQLFFRTPPPPV